MSRRLSGKVRGRPLDAAVASAVCAARPAAAVSGCDGGAAVAVELEEIVGGCDEPPFRPAGRSAAALEASDLAVELQLAEDGLDGDLSSPVSGAPDGRGEHAAHEVIEAAGPSRSRRRAEPEVGGDEDLDAVADNRFDLARVPVAGVRDDDGRLVEVDAS